MKKVIYILAAVSAIAFTSCADFLEKQPALSQSTELTLSSYDGLNSATLGAYEYFASSGWFGGDWVLSAEMRSGNGVKSLLHTSNRYTTEMNWNYTPDATSSQWAYSYYAIARANNVLNNLENVEADPQDLNNLKAECLFIRAISHLCCVLTYAQPYTYKPESLGVPVVLVTDSSGKPERATVKAVYEQIVQDLKDAADAIDPDYARSGVADAKAVVSLDAINALLSRVYLYMADWKNSADYATKVINSGNYTLYTADEYNKVWGKTTGGSEVIFEVYIDGTNYSNLDCQYMTYPDGAYGDCLCSPELYALYEDGDVRKANYRMDKDENQGLYWTGKYPGKGLYEGADANNVVVLRLSEMYLNRAECAMNGANTGTTAVADLNAIAAARGASLYSSVGAADIQNERRKELAWEGHYLFDLARWNKSIKRTSDSFLTAKNANIDFPSYRWALPIAMRELNVNENLVQNEGYAE